LRRRDGTAKIGASVTVMGMTIRRDATSALTFASALFALPRPSPFRRWPAAFAPTIGERVIRFSVMPMTFLSLQQLPTIVNNLFRTDADIFFSSKK
jgi:hypothetical protein